MLCCFYILELLERYSFSLISPMLAYLSTIFLPDLIYRQFPAFADHLLSNLSNFKQSQRLSQFFFKSFSQCSAYYIAFWWFLIRSLFLFISATKYYFFQFTFFLLSRTAQKNLGTLFQYQSLVNLKSMVNLEVISETNVRQFLISSFICSFIILWSRQINQICYFNLDNFYYNPAKQRQHTLFSNRLSVSSIVSTLQTDQAKFIFEADNGIQKEDSMTDLLFISYFINKFSSLRLLGSSLTVWEGNC